MDDIEYVYDASTALTQGRRDLQEDAIAAHFPDGFGRGYVVLADGMGGHAAGDVASRIVVQEVFDELRVHFDDPPQFENNIGAVLRRALDRANVQVARHAFDRPETRGMGSTLVAPLIFANRLYWISVGDSPLYLLRGKRMARLNQEHSMARHMQRLVTQGVISQREADHDPDRDCLTSVLFGAAIPEVDCRDRPLDLEDGDILIVASDGLQFIDEARIATLVYDNRDQPSAVISARLIAEIRDANDPDQDNVSLCVLKVSAHCRPLIPAAVPSEVDAIPRPRRVTRSTLAVRVQRRGERLAYDSSSLREI